VTEKTALLAKDLAVLKSNLRGAFQSNKDNLDMHLDSINQNTNEIQSNYEYVAEIDAKVEKLMEKVVEIQMQLNPNAYQNAFDDIMLSKREQELFLGIYTEEDRISVLNLSKKMGLTLEMCETLISSMKVKGIPVVRQLVNEEMLISLDYTFKDLQARKNILNIDMTISQMIG